MISPIERNAQINRTEAAERRQILESLPQLVFVELSRACDLSCWMCHRFLLPKATFQHMPDAVIDKLAEEVFPTCRIVDLHGLGESTLHPRCAEIVRVITAKGSRVRMVTNLNNPPHAVLDSLVECDAMICFSLGSTTEEGYRAIYRRGELSKVLANLGYLRELRSRSGLCADMRCMTMIYEPNLSELKGLLRLITEYGVRRLHAWPMYLPKDDDPRYVGRHLDRWTSTIQEAFHVADELGVEMRIVDWPVRPEGSTKTLENFTCHRPWSHAMVNYDGTLGLCDYNEHTPALRALSVRDHTFRELWNHSCYQEIRKNFAAGVPEKSDVFCGNRCRLTKYVDFDDDIFPELRGRILSNHSPQL